MPETAKSLRIVVINSLEPSHPSGHDELPARARALRVGLLEAGYNIVAVLPPEAFNAELVAQLRPDVLIVDAETDPAATLARITAVNSVSPKPIVLFTEAHDSELARQAVQVGVSSYIVAGLAPERVKPILEVAIARFEHEQKLRSDLFEAREKLSERIVIEKAKGLLMDEPFGALDALTCAHLQDELLKIVANTRSTCMMVTHDVDEAVLLSDRIVMMTNGPAATIGEILTVDLERPRNRITLGKDPKYMSYRQQVIEFLYMRHAKPELQSA